MLDGPRNAGGASGAAGGQAGTAPQATTPPTNDPVEEEIKVEDIPF